MSAKFLPAIILFSVTVGLPAQERKLTRQQLPAPVAAAVDREAKGATVKGFSTEREHGQRVFEAETLVNGHTRDLQFASDGTLQEVEEEVAFESLPELVKQGLNQRSNGARITKVESLTKHGALVAYEAATLKDGKKGEVQVGPNGEKLTHEE